jgi:type IV pilus assembly protein PilV
MRVGLKNKIAGVSLVEVLVTLVLTSVGLLGVAALQVTSLKGNKEAYIRSQASVLAADILERMRANYAGFRSGEYTTEFNGVNDASTVAGRDLAAWQADIDALLPGSDLPAPTGEGSGNVPAGRQPMS